MSVGANGRGDRPRRARGRGARRIRVQPSAATGPTPTTEITEVEASSVQPPPYPGARRSLSEALGKAATRADTVLGPGAPASIWADITASLDFKSSHPPTTSNGAAVRDGSHDPHEPLDLHLDADGVSHDDNLFLADALSASPIPRDDSLKYRVDVTSPFPLAWTLSRSTMSECRAVHTLSTTGGANIDMDIDIDAEMDEMPDNFQGVAQEMAVGDEAMHLFCLSLMHYQHPAEKLTAKHASTWISDLGDVKSLASARVEIWQDTLRSLFYAYRQNFVAHFYVQLSTTTVRFGRSGDDSNRNRNRRSEAGGGTLRAEFSRATAGLRNILLEYGVVFEIHNAQTPSDPQPCIVVEGGAGNIQALYNVLHAAGPTLADAKDVPVLISDWPFKGATLTSSVPGNVRDIIVERTASQVKRRYSVEISGNTGRYVFTPTQIRRLHSAVRMAQRNSAEIHMKTVTNSARLNVCSLLDETGGGGTLGNNVISRIRMRNGSERPQVFTISAELQT